MTEMFLLECADEEEADGQADKETSTLASPDDGMHYACSVSSANTSVLLPLTAFTALLQMPRCRIRVTHIVGWIPMISVSRR